MSKLFAFKNTGQELGGKASRILFDSHQGRVFELLQAVGID